MLAAWEALVASAAFEALAVLAVQVVDVDRLSCSNWAVDMLSCRNSAASPLQPYHHRQVDLAAALIRCSSNNSTLALPEVPAASL